MRWGSFLAKILSSLKQIFMKQRLSSRIKENFFLSLFSLLFSSSLHMRERSCLTLFTSDVYNTCRNEKNEFFALCVLSSWWNWLIVETIEFWWQMQIDIEIFNSNFKSAFKNQWKINYRKIERRMFGLYWLNIDELLRCDRSFFLRKIYFKIFFLTSVD